MNDDEKDNIYITDLTGKEGDIVHAVHNCNFKPESFQFGLDPFAIEALLEPKFNHPEDDVRPQEDELHLMIALNLNGFSKGYSLHTMKYFQVANDMYSKTPAAV